MLVTIHSYLREPFPNRKGNEFLGVVGFFFHSSKKVNYFCTIIRSSFDGTMRMSRETREGIRSFVLDGLSWQQFRIAVRDNE